MHIDLMENAICWYLPPGNKSKPWNQRHTNKSKISMIHSLLQTTIENIYKRNKHGYILQLPLTYILDKIFFICYYLLPSYKSCTLWDDLFLQYVRLAGGRYVVVSTDRAADVRVLRASGEHLYTRVTSHVASTHGTHGGCKGTFTLGTAARVRMGNTGAWVILDPVHQTVPWSLGPWGDGR